MIQSKHIKSVTCSNVFLNICIDSEVSKIYLNFCPWLIYFNNKMYLQNIIISYISFLINIFYYEKDFLEETVFGRKLKIKLIHIGLSNAVPVNIAHRLL